MTVATSLEFFFYPVTLQSSYFEVDSAKLDDISNSKGMCLVLWTEIFQDLVNTLFLSDNQPHCFFEIDIIFFVFFKISFFLTVYNPVKRDTIARWVWDLFEPLLIDLWLVEAPKNAFVMFVQKTENKTIIVMLLGYVYFFCLFARYFQRISQNDSIGGSLVIWHVKVMNHANLTIGVGLKHEVLVVVLLVLVGVEVDAVKIEETMRKLVAGEGAENEIRTVSVVDKNVWEYRTELSRPFLLFTGWDKFGLLFVFFFGLDFD